jgi:uncharacterized phage protein (TIGR01671 family)
MREIKFRAWNKGKMWHAADIEWIVAHWTFSMKDTILMQYTGLKDKNGVEIYEGDIVQTYQGQAICIKFENGAFVWADGEPLGFGICQENPYKQPVFKPEPTNEWCEIIGNIHENPELIK